MKAHHETPTRRKNPKSAGCGSPGTRPPPANASQQAHSSSNATRRTRLMLRTRGPRPSKR
jgi:hypothetical protein